MGIEQMGMGGNGNVKSHSRTSLVRTIVLRACDRLKAPSQIGVRDRVCIRPAPCESIPTGRHYHQTRRPRPPHQRRPSTSAYLRRPATRFLFQRVPSVAVATGRGAGTSWNGDPPRTGVTKSPLYVCDERQRLSSSASRFWTNSFTAADSLTVISATTRLV